MLKNVKKMFDIWFFVWYYRVVRCKNLLKGDRLWEKDKKEDKNSSNARFANAKHH